MKRDSVKLKIKTNYQNFTKKEKIISDFSKIFKDVNCD